MRRANVYCLGVPTGILSGGREGYRFRYLPEYLRDPKAPAINLIFPKREAAFESAALFPYFYGMLAEGDNKKVQCRVMKFSLEAEVSYVDVEPSSIHRNSPKTKLNCSGGKPAVAPPFPSLEKPASLPPPERK